MKTLSSALVVAAVAWVLTPALVGAAEFSADFTEYKSFVPPQEQNKLGKIYVKGERIRMDFQMDGKVSGAQIIDQQAKRTWILMHEEKAYMEMSLGADNPVVAAGEQTDVERALLGSEKVSGYACDKYRITLKKSPNDSTIVWMSKKLQYPLRSEYRSASGGVMRTELTNINEGAQPEKLFALPKDYQKMVMPGFGSSGSGTAPSAEEDEEEAAVKDEAKPTKKKPSAVKEDAKEIGDDARSEAKDAVKEEVGESIRKGIRGLFGRE